MSRQIDLLQRTPTPLNGDDLNHLSGLRQVALPGALVLVFNQHGELCLLQRDDSPMHCLLGGRLDDGETFAKACVREVHEETGAELSSEAIDPLAAYHMGYDENPTAAYGRLYAARIDTSQTKFVLGNEGVGLAWVSWNKLPKNTSFPQALLLNRVSDVIERYLEGTAIPRTTAEVDSVVHVCMAAGTAMSNFNKLQIHTRRELLPWRDHPHVVKRRFEGKLIFDIDGDGCGIEPVSKALELARV